MFALTSDWVIDRLDEGRWNRRKQKTRHCMKPWRAGATFQCTNRSGEACSMAYVPVATSSNTFNETMFSVTPFGLDFMFEDQFVA